MRPKIVFEQVSKSFNLYRKQSEKLWEILFFKKEKDNFFALNNISFVINEGETVGIVGLNGSGKSTVSNLMAKIIPPTKGSIDINGQTSLIAISAGLNNQLSGLENIKLKCLMHGMNQQEIKKVIPNIIEFADIGKFIEQPVKNYSSGMKSRLGFAISIHTNPDVLIVDEALSVGDQTFYQKCIDKMNQYKSEGKTIIFISHSLSQVESFCDRVIWMNYGMMEKFDETKKVLKEYKEFIKWFNALNESEKQLYKSEKLEAQYKEEELSSIKEKKLYKTKKEKRERFSFIINFAFLFIVSIISALFLFGVLSVQNIEKIFSNTQIVNHGTADETAIKTNVATEKIKQGMVLAENISVYQEQELKTEITEVKFADVLFVDELIGDVYKVSTNNRIGYVPKDKIGVLTQEIQELDMEVEDFLDFFPPVFSNSYQYFFAFLNADSEDLKSRLRSLTAEERFEDGTSTLRYAEYGVQYTINQENIAQSLAINNINLSDNTLDEILKEATLVSEDGMLYLFVTREFRVLMDIESEKLLFIIN